MALKLHSIIAGKPFVLSLIMFFFFAAAVEAEDISGLGLLPPRGAEARAASELLFKISDLNATVTQELLVGELLRGNVPEGLRNMQEVCWDEVTTGVGGAMKVTRVCISVTPDYLSVGSDGDFMRVPLMPHFAQVVADESDCLLPTRQMVDRIYSAAGTKLAPRPFSPKVFEISSPTVWMLSNEAINGQLGRRGDRAAKLVAGIKKDVVITARLTEKAKSPRVAIYGWHKLDGAPIQPLTLVHGAGYVDYSHGIRLVSKRMTIDGVSTETVSVLQDPQLAHLLSDEGALNGQQVRYPVYR